MITSNLINAWRHAMTDLQIIIQTPYILTTESNKNLKFELLVENFGSKHGTLIFAIGENINVEIIKKHGYYCSFLGETYSIYNRQLFIDTLNDWGYFGDKSLTPNWYAGHPWT